MAGSRVPAAVETAGIELRSHRPRHHVMVELVQELDHLQPIWPRADQLGDNPQKRPDVDYAIGELESSAGSHLFCMESTRRASRVLAADAPLFSGMRHKQLGQIGGQRQGRIDVQQQAAFLQSTRHQSGADHVSIATKPHRPIEQQIEPRAE